MQTELSGGAMKYIKELAVIMAVSFIGEVLAAVLPLPVPAGIYGIVILFLLLQTKLLPLSAVEKTGDFLIDIMPLMFIPAAVGLIDCREELRGSAVSYLVICLVSTVAVMVISGTVTELILKHGRKEK